MRTISRRRFIKESGTGIVVGGAISSGTTVLALPDGAEATTITGPSTRVVLKVNGEEYRLEVEDRWTLVEVLRDHLRLTGTKVGCNEGECGSCTVLLDGNAVYSCSYLAVWADGKDITTIEGLCPGESLDPLQEAFIRHDGPQCGFCSPGQTMAARALLSRNPNPSRGEVQHGLAGNLCRCSGYNHYVAAVLEVVGTATPTGGQDND